MNTNSSPSTLKITDLRVATVVKPGPSPCPIIRIDTNQGVYGLGEVRDGASPTYALFLEKPHPGRESAAAGQDLPQDQTIWRACAAGRRRLRHRDGLVGHRGQGLQRAAYALVGGGKFRDKIRVYADTTESKDPKIYAQRMKERKEVMGLTWLKMDLGIEMVADTPGTVTNALGH